MNREDEQVHSPIANYRVFETRPEAVSHPNAALIVRGLFSKKRTPAWLTCPVSKLKANETDVDRAADLLAQLITVGTYWPPLAADFRHHWIKEYIDLPVGLTLPDEPKRTMRDGLWLSEGWWEEDYVDLYRRLDDLLCSDNPTLGIPPEYPEIDTTSMTIAEAHQYTGSYVKLWSGVCHRWVVQAPIGMVHVDRDHLMLLLSEINRLYLARPEFMQRYETVPDKIELRVNAGKYRRQQYPDRSAFLLVSGKSELEPRINQIAAFLRGERMTLSDPDR